MRLNDNKTSQDAVSPVVGVMLMLVVTIIIAAVVSAFSGGLTQTEDAPQATISATFSQSKGMTIFHEGGYPLNPFYTSLLIRPDYSNSGGDQSYQVNLTKVGNMDNSCMWYVINSDTSSGCIIREFKTGDVAHIMPENLKWTQVRPDGTVVYFASYGMGHSNQVGTPWILEMVDYRTGKILATTKFMVNP